MAAGVGGRPEVRLHHIVGDDPVDRCAGRGGQDLLEEIAAEEIAKGEPVRLRSPAQKREGLDHLSSSPSRQTATDRRSGGVAQRSTSYRAWMKPASTPGSAALPS